MASILDVVVGLNQAAANAYDGYDTENSIGLKREEGHPILDSRVMDGFSVKFSADKMILSYQSEVTMKEVHPRTQFENEVERTLGDIIKFIKKEYNNVTGKNVNLTAVGDADILVQTTSRVRNWVQATKQYKIGGAGDTESLLVPSTGKMETGIKKFLDLSATKRPRNDKAGKNPDTPKG